MKILDRYILKTFLVTFVFALLLFITITLAVDASEKADDFVKSGLSTGQIIEKYYYGFLPHITSLLFPIFVLIAVVFFTSKLAGRSEVVAILSVGVSLRRFLFPYWVGGILLALTLGLANHFMIPIANKIRTDFESKYLDMGNFLKQQRQYLSNIHFRIDTFTYGGIRNYDTLTKSGNGFFMQRINGNKVVYNLRSESILWDTTKRQWKIETAIERKINGLKEEVKIIPSMYVKLGYRPYEISDDEYLKDKLKTPALNRFIKQEEKRGSEDINVYKYERYRRDSQAVAVVIMTMIGAILASRKIRGGSGFHLAAAFVIGVLFEVTNRFSMVFSTKGNLPPVIAAWLPNVFFALIAWWLYSRSPK